MGGEIERAKMAINLVKKGKTVAIVCSGDAGIYGMAGLVNEILHEQGDELEIEVIPGVPAMVAVAALLGSPLMSDFAAISLSDYLVSWAEISQRLKLAAQGDFVIALYNPSSKSRQHQLAEARGIILQYRSNSTPVGIATNAYRQKQRVVITDLEHMLDYEAGMNTTIIIGNSTTFTFNGRMVTPRGYQTKYSLRDKALP
jgi:precorrin-3B C17-methyltransferase